MVEKWKDPEFYGKLTGERAFLWSGGKCRAATGYVREYQGFRKRPIWQHIRIVEDAIGRKLKPGECVHHVNGVHDDNRNNNLVVCNRKYHSWLHQRMSELYMKEHFQRPGTAGA
jgi:hypothetical protein